MSRMLALLVRIAERLDSKPEAARNERFRSILGRFMAIDQRLAKIEGDFNQRFASIGGDLKLSTWMIGLNLSATVGVFSMVLRH
jgi:hypothetical protein